MSPTALRERSDTQWTAGCRQRQEISAECVFCPLQLKYKEDGKKELSTNLYSVLPETEEMKLAKAAMELQSEVGGRLESAITPTGH